MIKILFLAANPSDTTRLRLDEENRAIDQVLRQAEFRDKFEIHQHWAVRVTEIQSFLLRYKPDIVHFSGHGSNSGEIVLEEDNGKAHPISVRAIEQLFSILKDNVRCVILNACFSELQAASIAKHIDCVIGMSKSISDKAAISFAASFYQALGYGKDVKTAFDLGVLQIDMENLGEQDIPKLLSIKSDPISISFIQSLSKIVLEPCSFVTEKILKAEGGFKVQFSLSNSSTKGQLNVYDIAPIVFFQHYHENYLEIEPRVLSKVTIENVRLMRKVHPGKLLESGDSVFASLNITGGKSYRLSPGEIESFSCQFVVDKHVYATRALGLVIRYSDSQGKQFFRTSDCVYVFEVDCGIIGLAKYNLDALRDRITNIHTFNFSKDNIFIEDQFFDMPDEQEIPTGDVVTISVDPDDIHEIIERIPCNWKALLGESISFLESRAIQGEEMQQVDKL